MATARIIAGFVAIFYFHKCQTREYSIVRFKSKLQDFIFPPPPQHLEIYQICLFVKPAPTIFLTLGKSSNTWYSLVSQAIITFSTTHTQISQSVYRQIPPHTAPNLPVPQKLFIKICNCFFRIFFEFVNNISEMSPWNRTQFIHYLRTDIIIVQFCHNLWHLSTIFSFPTL